MMSWQTHKTGIGNGKTYNHFAPFNPFAFTAGVRTRQADELSLTATNIPTPALHPATVPRERTKGLSRSDPQGVPFAREKERAPILRRTKTEECTFESVKPPPTSQKKLPPISASIGNPLLSSEHELLGLTGSQSSLESTDEDSTTDDDVGVSTCT